CEVEVMAYLPFARWRLWSIPPRFSTTTSTSQATRHRNRPQLRPRGAQTIIANPGREKGTLADAQASTAQDGEGPDPGPQNRLIGVCCGSGLRRRGAF